jgi:RsiW-degrading membrane proteinase PrsW (M82 family)
MTTMTPQPTGGSPYAPGRSPQGSPRARARSWLTRAVVMMFTAGCGLLSVGAIATETGAAGLVTGTVLAAIPVFPVVATFLWLDRYEAEPAYLLSFAFAWGAGVATFAALVINTASVQAIRASGGDPTLSAVLVAPLSEELFKGLAVLGILLLQRREFDGVIDGIVYAGMAGIGFAFVENILYLGRTLEEGGGVATGVVFVLRCIVSPFAHPLFTCAIGVGLGLAARARNKGWAVLAPLLGYLVAVLLHGAWNLSASSGLNGFVAGYVVLQVPVFLLFGLMAVLARRREGRLIERNLAVYGATGWLAGGEVNMLGSLPMRRRARHWAQANGGQVGERAMREFQDLGSELAFLRERMVRGTAALTAREQEYAMLTAMAGLRRVFSQPPRVGGR